MSDGIMSNLEDAQECVERVLASQDGYRSIEFSACVESSDACAASDHDSVSESFGTARLAMVEAIERDADAFVGIATALEDADRSAAAALLAGM